MHQENINNIFLIGMMGSWKSTVGRELAKIMNMDFIDTDDEIEEVTEMKVSDIFRDFGEHRFREMEASYFIEKSKKNRQVFSTGGGIILNSQNRIVLQECGTCFFLEASPKILSHRIHNTKKRPLLIDNSKNIEDKLFEIWNDRKHYYKQCAHYTINTDNLEPVEVINEIIRILEKNIENY